MTNSWEYPGDVYEIIRKYHRKLQQEIYFLESYGLTRGKKYLDVGCATGVLLREFSDRGVESTGIDSSSEFVRFGKKEIASRKLINANIIHSSIENYHPNSGEFDFITCLFNTISYLESYETIEAALTKIRTALREGGVFVLEFAFYLNFVSSFKDSMTINHFNGDINITRLIKHSINPHRATWNHEETIFVQRQSEPFETFFVSQPQVVVLPPVMEQILKRVGFQKVEFWGTWEKGRQVVGHSTCIAVAS